MCGRYYRRSDKQRIAEAFKLGKLPPDFVLPPDYNIAPSPFQPVIRPNPVSGGFCPPAPQSRKGSFTRQTHAKNSSLRCLGARLSNQFDRDGV
jgi:putative SOS response-associated peptidase YedK